MKIYRISNNEDIRLFDKFVDEGGSVNHTTNYKGRECWDVNTPDGDHTWTVYNSSEVMDEIRNYYRKSQWMANMTMPHAELIARQRLGDLFLSVEKNVSSKDGG